MNDNQKNRLRHDSSANSQTNSSILEKPNKQASLQVSTEVNGVLYKAGLRIPEKTNAFNLSNDAKSKYLKKLKESHNKQNDKPEGSELLVRGGVKEYGQVTRTPENLRGKPNLAEFKPQDNVTFCDYLKVSTRDTDVRDTAMSDIRLIFDKVLIRMYDRKKGAQGYDSSFELRMIDPDTGEDCNAGFYYLSESGQNAGGYLELKGEPCRRIQNDFPLLWNQLIDTLELSGWSISSIDLALDVHGDTAIEYGYTVPYFDKAAYSGLFKSDKLKDNNVTRQTQRIDGDWSDIHHSDDVNYSNYDPRKHCKGGLTVYVGGKKSADRWKVYEKAKERMAKGCNAGGNDLAWVRIEHTLKKVTAKKVPWDALRQPDKHFSRDRSKVIAIMQLVRLKSDKNPTETILSVSQKKTKNMTYEHQLHYARQQVSGFINRDLIRGKTDKEIIDLLGRDEGRKRPKVKKTKAGYVSLDVSQAANGEWIPDLLQITTRVKKVSRPIHARS